MKTLRNLKEYFSVDENIIRVINGFLSLTVKQIRSYAGTLMSFNLILEDVIRKENFDANRTEGMSLREFLTLLSASRTSDPYWFTDTNNNLITSHDNYLFYADRLAVYLYNIRSDCSDIDKLLNIPLQMLISVLHGNNTFRRRMFLEKLSKVYYQETIDRSKRFDEITMEQMLETINRISRKQWTPTELPINEFKERRERLCWANGMLVIDLFVRSPFCDADVRSIRKKYGKYLFEDDTPVEQISETDVEHETIKR